jgi:hypothetical protein
VEKEVKKGGVLVRRLLVLVVMVFLMALVIAPAALADSPWAGCPVGPQDAGGSTIGEWQLWTEEDAVEALITAGFDPADAAPQWAKYDKNGDGYLCTMTQILPNDNSGSAIWYVSHDNNAKVK